MERALKETGVPAESLYFPKKGHGFYTAPHRRGSPTRVLAFLNRQAGQHGQASGRRVIRVCPDDTCGPATWRGDALAMDMAQHRPPHLHAAQLAGIGFIWYCAGGVAPSRYCTK